LLLMHAADLHVGARPYRLEGLARVFIDSFDELVEAAARERVDALLIAGDLFDRPRPEHGVFLHVARRLRWLASRGVRIVAAHGEHDTPGRRDVTALEVLDGLIDGFYAPRARGSDAESLASTIVDLGGVRVAVYPLVKADYSARKRIAERVLSTYSHLLAGGPGRRVLLAHIGVQEAVGCPSPDPEECPFDAPLSLLPPVDYAALGHIHKRWLRLSPDPGPPAAYPGSLFPKDVQEARDRFPRGPLLVDLSGDEPAVQEVDLGVADYAIAGAEVEKPGAARKAIAAALEEAVRRMAPRRHRVVFLEVLLGPTVSVAEVERAAAQAAEGLGVVAAVRPRRRPLSRPSVDAARGEIAAGEGFDPARIIAGRYRLSQATAEKILELKEALLEEGPSSPRILEILDELARRDDFRRLMGEVAGRKR